VFHLRQNSKARRLAVFVLRPALKGKQTRKKGQGTLCKGRGVTEEGQGAIQRRQGAVPCYFAVNETLYFNSIFV
jgi:hypothetical protein